MARLSTFTQCRRTKIHDQLEHFRHRPWDVGAELGPDVDLVGQHPDQQNFFQLDACRGVQRFMQARMVRAQAHVRAVFLNCPLSKVTSSSSSRAAASASISNRGSTCRGRGVSTSSPNSYLRGRDTLGDDLRAETVILEKDVVHTGDEDMGRHIARVFNYRSSS